MFQQKIKKPTQLINGRTGEIWLCSDPTKVKTVDGNDFLEVYKEGSHRTFLISKLALTKVKK